MPGTGHGRPILAASTMRWPPDCGRWSRSTTGLRPPDPRFACPGRRVRRRGHPTERGAEPAKDPLTIAAAATVGVVGAARLTRLITKDHWPPMSYVRQKYVERTEGTEWSVLAECPFCVAP